jgi:ribonuclease HI
MTNTKKLSIHTDGGSRGNPGPSAIGVVMEEEGKIFYTYGKPIGSGTNNQAEYEAVTESLRYVKKMFVEKGDGVECSLFLDSLLVVQQLKGLFKIKQPDLRIRALAIQILIQEIGGAVQFFHIPRLENSKADDLVNQALDSGKEIISKP